MFEEFSPIFSHLHFGLIHLNSFPVFSENVLWVGSSPHKSKKIILQGIIGINSLIKLCKSPQVCPRSLCRFGPLTGSKSNHLHMDRIPSWWSLIVRMCTYRNSWLKTAKKNYCYWIVSGDRCWESVFVLDPERWLRSDRYSFILWRTSRKSHHPEWPTPLKWWHLTATCSSPAYRTKKRKKESTIRGSSGLCSQQAFTTILFYCLFSVFFFTSTFSTQLIKTTLTAVTWHEVFSYFDWGFLQYSPTTEWTRQYRFNKIMIRQL